MCASPKNAFENLVQAQQEFRQTISHFTGNQAAFRPGEGQWSALQVLDHLIEIEKLVYVSAKQSLKSATGVDKVSLLSQIKFQLAKLILNTSRRLKTPAGVPEPQARKTLDAYLAEWSKLRERWKEYITEIGPEKNSLQAFRHPIAGPMTIAMALEFLAVHIRHHLHQLNRLEKHPNLPGK